MREYPGLAGYDALTQIETSLLQLEHLLSGAWATPEDILSTEHVAQRFDAWIAHLTPLAASHSLGEPMQPCLLQFVNITQGLRPHFIQCDDLEGFPRTNNEMEGYIRSLKTRYRRVSGRKNWNSYLLRYGRCVAYYDWVARARGSALPRSLNCSRVSDINSGKPCERATALNNRDNSNSIAFAIGVNASSLS